MSDVVPEIIDLWPPMPPEDPRQDRRKAAMLEVLDPLRRPIVQVQCVAVRHRPHDGGAPPLADVYDSSYGPLYLATIELRVEDWGPEEPPFEAVQDKPGDELLGVPAVLTCVLLRDDDLPPLRAKCRDHGLVTIDPLRLFRAYHTTLDERRARGSAQEPEGTVVVSLEDVVASR